MPKSVVYSTVIAIVLALGVSVPAHSTPASKERVTNADFPTQLRPEPDSLKSLAKIPPGTAVTISDMRVIQLDTYKENWYLIDYQGALGWVRGDDLDGESAEKSYSVTYQAPDGATSSASPGGMSF